MTDWIQLLRVLAVITTDFSGDIIANYLGDELDLIGIDCFTCSGDYGLIIFALLTQVSFVSVDESARSHGRVRNLGRRGGGVRVFGL